MTQDERNERTARKARTRRRAMARLRRRGWTLAAIGRRFGGISRQRVRAILAREPA